MSMGKRSSEQQDPLWIPTQNIARGPGSPFYSRLNTVLAEAGFDRWVEKQCQRFYAEKKGRPGVPPGVYFRMLMIGYFEGLDSERGIAWRCADSLSLREFLGYDLTEHTPDHSTLSVIRNRIDIETHQEVFGWILKRLAEQGLISGKTIGVDATTLEANAALRSLVRRDTGESYEEFLTALAKESGIETPTRQDLARLDRKRKGKGSNDDWSNPNDPDAKITKMKDGRTHLAHKAEHAVDMDSGATLAVTVQPANRGDTKSIGETLMEVLENLDEASGDDQRFEIQELVADKGYHSNDVLRDLAEMKIRTYVSEPDRGRRRWRNRDRERHAVYGNRRRIRRARGKALLRRRGELLERPFAHCYETGAMRRIHLRGHAKILKRLLIHVATSNLALLMRTLFGVGKPKALQGRSGRAWALLRRFCRALGCAHSRWTLGWLSTNIRVEIRALVGPRLSIA
jgi:transposase